MTTQLELDGLALLRAIRGGDRDPETILAYADWLADRVSPTVYVWDNGESSSDHDILFISADGLEPEGVIAAYKAHAKKGRYPSDSGVVAHAAHWCGETTPMNEHITPDDFFNRTYDPVAHRCVLEGPNSFWDGCPAVVVRWLWRQWQTSYKAAHAVNWQEVFETEARRRGLLPPDATTEI